jgi:beta-N-acetylhexosaminidase
MGSRPRLPVLALLLAAALLATAVAVARSGSSSGGGRAPATSAAVADLAASARRTAAVQRMTADQLAGQRIIYAYSGLRPPASLLAAIRAGEAGGVIFFGSNISSLAQIRGVIAQLQRASLSSPVHTRLLMLTDQEGGEVRRLPGAPALSEKQIGQSRAAGSLARAAGTGAAHVLAGVGMNVNLAPVLDVYRRPGNFIDQFQRSYSSAPSTVAALGAAFIAAQQQLGVAATAKHFPGLGAAAQSQNTDLRPVSLGLSAATLRSADEAPYRSAIAAGVKLVMTSWAVYPALDPFRPAGLSPTVVKGELRRRLRFRGVTITDGIDAGAVTPYGSLARRSVLAADAGADLIVCAAVNPAANTPTQGITAMHAIAAAIASRAISTAAAQQAAARILALRSHP